MSKQTAWNWLLSCETITKAIGGGDVGWRGCGMIQVRWCWWCGGGGDVGSWWCDVGGVVLVGVGVVWGWCDVDGVVLRVSYLHCDPGKSIKVPFLNSPFHFNYSLWYNMLSTVLGRSGRCDMMVWGQGD